METPFDPQPATTDQTPATTSAPSAISHPPSPIPMTGQRYRELRLSLGLSQARLALLIGEHPNTIGQRETGIRPVSPAAAKDLETQVAKGPEAAKLLLDAIAFRQRRKKGEGRRKMDDGRRTMADGVKDVARENLAMTQHAPADPPMAEATNDTISHPPSAIKPFRRLDPLRS